MQIHLVDDDLNVLDATRFLLEQAGYQVKTWSKSKEFIENASHFEPAIVILDMNMPELDGRQVHQFLCEKQSTMSVIIMTAYADVSMAVQGLKQGAVDFLQKPVQFSQLQATLKLATEKTLANTQRHHIQTCYQQLSNKEIEILNLLLQGQINRQIAETLNISIRTVEVHRSHIMEKMQAQTIAELIYKITLIQ
ncbi:response regulator [Pasteurellaceae bacterium 22721_9_1]